jgi:hypothetical protein
VPGLGFAELGPGDLGLALGYVSVLRDPYPPEVREARDRVFAACRKYRIAFLETATPESIIAKLDEGVRVIARHREETAILSAGTRNAECRCSQYVLRPSLLLLLGEGLERRESVAPRLGQPHRPSKQWYADSPA